MNNKITAAKAIVSRKKKKPKGTVLPIILFVFVFVLDLVLCMSLHLKLYKNTWFWTNWIPTTLSPCLSLYCIRFCCLHLAFVFIFVFIFVFVFLFLHRCLWIGSVARWFIYIGKSRASHHDACFLASILRIGACAYILPVLVSLSCLMLPLPRLLFDLALCIYLWKSLSCTWFFFGAGRAKHYFIPVWAHSLPWRRWECEAHLSTDFEGNSVDVATTWIARLRDNKTPFFRCARSHICTPSRIERPSQIPSYSFKPRMTMDVIYSSTASSVCRWTVLKPS